MLPCSDGEPEPEEEEALVPDSGPTVSTPALAPEVFMSPLFDGEDEGEDEAFGPSVVIDSGGAEAEDPESGEDAAAAGTGAVGGASTVCFA